jgi:hypothetical protein
VRLTRWVLVSGMASIAVGVAVILASTPLALSSTNGIRTRADLITAESAGSVCQRGESLPGSTRAIRLTMTAIIGPRVSLKVFSGSRVVAHGTTGTGWSGSTVSVPVNALPTAYSPVELCVYISQLNGEVEFNGRPSEADAAIANGKTTIRGRVGVEYLRSGRQSWLSLLPSMARHLGLGRAPGGTWMAFVAALLTAALAVVASVLLLRELR